MALTSTPGFTFGATEVVTSTKLNQAATQTIADGQTYPFGSGTAAAPSVTFVGDTDTGLYRTVSDAIGVATGGALRGTFSSSGWAGNVVGNVTGNATNVTGTVAVANGGTGATTAAAARTALGIGTLGTQNSTGILGSGTASIAAGTGAGTSPTVSLVSGSNGIAGRIDLTTGTSPATSADWCTVTLPVTYSTNAWVVLQGCNAEASVVLGNGTLFVKPNLSTGTFVLRTGTGAPAAGVQYLINYIVVGG